jgi:hypothetical protein
MKTGLLLTLLSVCALAAFLSCNVGVTNPSGDDTGQGEQGKDTGSQPGNDGGAGSDGGVDKDAGACPAGSHEPTCHTDTDCAEGMICVQLVDGREECGTECRDSTTCPDYGAPIGQYCLRTSDCPKGYACEYFDPKRPECGGGCRYVDITDGGYPPDAGPLPCAELDFCGCTDRADCEVMSNGCICGCDYQCPGHDPCVCGCGGGEYLGCKEKSDPNPCGAGGFCRPGMMSSCGDPNYEAAPGLTCAFDDGGSGYCCLPIKTCGKDTDCPGCKMCEITRVGPRTCIEPAVGAKRCTKDEDCSPYYRCAAPLMTDKPECGGICVYDNVPDGGQPDAQTCVNPCDCQYGLFCVAGKCEPPGGGVGYVYCCDRPCPAGAPCQHANGAYDTCAGDADVQWPDAGSCVGEGQEINRTGDPNPPSCCPGLEALPVLEVVGVGGCAAPYCDCVVCTKPCGSGTCSTGKNACNCAKDCPASVPGGPGSTCTDNNDCTSGMCMSDKYGYPTGGYCMGDTCDPNQNQGGCPAGTVCTPMIISQALGHCMPSCRKDADCRQGLTCEWMPSYMGPPQGTYICWEAGKSGAILPGKGLGKTCAKDEDCLSQMCNGDPDTGAMECSVFCDTSQPCKVGMTCKPMGGCSSPQCGACF